MTKSFRALMRAWRPLAGAVVVAVCVLAVGCGSGHGRTATGGDGCFGSAPQPKRIITVNGQQVAADQIIVEFKPGTSSPQIGALLQQYNLTQLEVCAKPSF